VAKNLNRGKVLIVERDARALETIRVLLGSMGYWCVVAADEDKALALLEQENPNIAILDPQGESFSQLIPCLRGRVIVITDAKGNPEMDDRRGWSPAPRIQRDRLVHELESSLEALLWKSRALQQVTRVARLIYDSFRQPLPAGVRASEKMERRLVYERGAYSIDLCFELKTNPPVIQLVGQILDSANPGHRMEGIPVVVQGAKGQIASGITNEFGEFQFDVDVERNVIVDIETSKNYWVSLVSPSLEWATKTARAGS
jgi:CheY-like chemotaxis protein